MAVLAGVFVAVAVAVYLWTSDGGSDRPAPVPHEKRGVACPALRDAFEETQAGERESFRQSVDEAVRAGEEALDRSGQVFGQPERIAIELQYALATNAGQTSTELMRLLENARSACLRLGRWQPSGG